MPKARRRKTTPAFFGAQDEFTKLGSSPVCEVLMSSAFRGKDNVETLPIIFSEYFQLKLI